MRAWSSSSANQIVLIERRCGQPSDQRHYYVLPGGGVEPAETPTDAAVREAWEELGLRVTIERLIVTIEEDDQLQYIYLASITDGRHGSGRSDEMVALKPDDHGTYRPLWFPPNDLPHHPVSPEPAARLIYDAYRRGWRWPDDSPQR